MNQTAPLVGVTAPQGFLASGVHAGIKASSNRDVALVVNTGPTELRASAAVFTSNRVAAAPVHLSRAHFAAGTVSAVVLNSGGANACTGEQGARDAQQMADHVAQALSLADSMQVGVCSTGLIGELLPMEAVISGIDMAVGELADTPEAGANAADAIRTTDTVNKTIEIHADGYTVGGMAKGAGMLAPALATMLCVLTTDAVVDQRELDAALREAVRTTFNRMDSDGCRSTNDTVIALASGASGHHADAQELTEHLRSACATLARQLIADAEGATHDIDITVRGAHSEEAAEIIARAVARSNLLKAAIFGNDPNWGRVLSEIGTIPEEVAPFDPDAIDVSFNGVQVCQAGGVGQSRDLVDMTDRQVNIEVDLHNGSASATVITSDLTYDYVHENSAYSS